MPKIRLIASPKIGSSRDEQRAEHRRQRGERDRLGAHRRRLQ